MNNCLCCQKITTNPKYCSTSCAAKINNTKREIVKTKKNYYCSKCNVLLGLGSQHKRKYCEQCKLKYSPIYVDWSSVTLEDIFSRLPNFQANARIRSIARSVFNKNYKHITSCHNCGYSKFFEVCHIRPISDFPRNTPIAVVNDPNNLLPLCPNCHWELDHGLLKI